MFDPRDRRTHPFFGGPGAAVGTQHGTRPPNVFVQSESSSDAERIFSVMNDISYGRSGGMCLRFRPPLPYICQCCASCLLFCCALIIPPEPTASFSLRTDQFSTIGPVACVCTSTEENVFPVVPWQKPNRSDPCCFDRIPAWIPATKHCENAYLRTNSSPQ